MNNYLAEIANKYDTPLFVLDEAKLEQEVTNFVSAFKKHIYQVEVCYSVKTNYTPWIVKKICALGVKPEVIAGFELDLVSQLGISGPLYVNGPVKQSHELMQCIIAGHIINIDNIDELKLLVELVTQQKKLTNVGLRVRPEGESWKRFGIKFQSDAWFEALALIEECPYLNMQGLHMHIGTGIIDTKKYQQAAEYIKKIALSLPYALTFIDLGGGFATSTARLNNYSELDWQVPSSESYAKAIGDVLNGYLEKHDCKLVIEPGRALIDEAMDMITRVVSVNDERIIVDVGKNSVPSVETRVHPIKPLINSNGLSQRFDIFGPLCMGSDCLGRDILLNKPSVGDYFILKAVGAYSQSQAMNFIKFAPASVVIDKNNATHLIQRRQTIDDFMARDNYEQF